MHVLYATDGRVPAQAAAEMLTAIAGSGTEVSAVP
jgi:hypothetical protein